jgi:hypothetical protein
VATGASAACRACVQELMKGGPVAAPDADYRDPSAPNGSRSWWTGDIPSVGFNLSMHSSTDAPPTMGDGYHIISSRGVALCQAPDVRLYSTLPSGVSEEP